MNDFNFMGLSPEAILILKDIKNKEKSGEIIDPQISEALKAIEIASKVVNTIMSGNQIDPVFFKSLSDLTERKIKEVSGIKSEKKVIKKKHKLRRKS